MSLPRLSLCVLVGLALLLPLPGRAEPGARVEAFSPTGTVKGVRQVTARFSAPMVPFGDPRLVEPFDIQCSQPGTGRWADPRNWVYDFGHDLPAGVACTFRLKDGITSLAGEPLAGPTEFVFDTGGPSVRRMMPWEGSSIDEEQVFILGLDAPPDLPSVLEHAWCDVEGIGEKVGVRLLDEAQRAELLRHNRHLFDQVIRAIVIRKDDGAIIGGLDTGDVLKGTDLERMITRPEASPIVVLACQRRLPYQARMRLVWGAGIRSRSGIATTTDQSSVFRVRPDLRASFNCSRVNPDAQCIPLLPMFLNFTAPVPRTLAAKIELRAADGTRYRPEFGEGQTEQAVSTVTFTGPFPEKTAFTVTLPREMRDDAGRRLSNTDMFPLEVATDEYPPLAKFPARFGIIELNADAALPVTVRNIEAQLQAQLMTVETVNDDMVARMKDRLRGLFRRDESVGASLLQVDTAEVIQWLRRLRKAERSEGEQSVMGADLQPQRLAIPRAEGNGDFEVIGIPLKKAGFYVVELASPRLGAALLREHGKAEDAVKPYYAQTAALVTNLSVHFKHGRESSLVWVTHLDQGAPVANARVQVSGCDGTVHWSGTTDAQGIARIAEALPNKDVLPGCLDGWDREYFVTAQTSDDFSFVLSSWDEGITPWRFQLPTGRYGGPYIASTVFDRTLLRAGDTVSMTHFFRRHTGTGFELVDKSKLPNRLVIRHVGSDQRFEQTLDWDARNVAESRWQIPQDAKLGTYQVRFEPHDPTRQLAGLDAGSFRVEAFRVPTVRAMLKPLHTPLVNATGAVVDAQLNYFSGGGVSGAPVKFRGLVEPYAPSFSGYDGFVFVNGNVKEGRSENLRQRWYIDDYALDEEEQPGDPRTRVLATRSLNLDGAGAARVRFDDLPLSDEPRMFRAEMEYADANGEILTSATRVPLWPADVVVGVKPDAWAASKEKIRFQTVALGLDGKPRTGVAIKLDLLQRTHFSHRKRLIGGFYAYESYAEVKRVKDACEGRTDSKGLLLCEFSSPVDGNVILRARAVDEAGNAIYAHQDVWVAGEDDWWFDVSNDDRMDVLPEKRRYEPGETAVFQVRMPFREATALVTVEREGVSESFVTRLSGKAPVVRVPLKAHHAPNVYVSVLAVRGRVADVQPTAVIDLGKPAFKLGIAAVKVGWKGHELKVDVAPDDAAYKVRTTSTVKVKVRNPDGTPARDGEVAFAAVDEGLLELMPNPSWNLLEAMMVERGIEVSTATAQMQVVGRRHYGRKAVAAGGGGSGNGQQTARELFDTLLLWQGRVALDDKGEAVIKVPINDSLTSFRLVAVAHAGAGRFGTGRASIRTTQDLMVLPGLPPQVREQDRFAAGITVRNTTEKPMQVTVNAGWSAVEVQSNAKIAPGVLAPQQIALVPGQAQALSWDVTVPLDARRLQWTFNARTAGAEDQVKVTQEVIPAVAARTFQASLMQLDQSLSLPVAIPADAIPGRGGIQVHLRARLADELSGVQEYMRRYPYTCLEQRASQVIVLGDEAGWERLVNGLPAYLDGDGLAKYFPVMRQGSETLTAYLLIIAEEAGWSIPEASRTRMLHGLKGFVQGKVVRHSSLPTADLTLRKLSALNALARHEQGIRADLLGSLTIDPNLWPTSAVLDWIDILKRSPQLREREMRLAEARQIIRARLNFQGTIMGFSTERADALWWLMCSADTNANRALLSLMDAEDWREDLPRMVRGSLGRQHRGHWGTTVANAWGTLAMARFSERFEATPVEGQTAARLEDAAETHDWAAQPGGATLDFAWPTAAATIDVNHAGAGKPWVTVQSLAAIPLQQPFSSGYTIQRTVTPVEQKAPGVWSRGDVYRVRLDLEAQTDMTWVVVRDPIPSGASILGTGLGGDSQFLTRGEKRQGWVWPAFEERTHESFRAYYEFVPKGRWTVEYTVRLNNAGRFALPETRVEALYAPEAFAEIPNQAVEVRP